MSCTRPSFNGSSAAASQGVPDSADLITRAFQWVVLAMRRVVCAAMGHERVLQFESHRLSLRCIVCGHQTVGWIIGEPEPTKVITPSVSHARIEPRRAA